MVSAIKGKECLTPKKPAFSKWNVNDLHKKERRNLDPTIIEVKYVEKLHSQTREKINITDEDQIILSKKEAYKNKTSPAAQANYHRGSTLAIDALKPKRDEHEEPDELIGVNSKWLELQQHENLSIFGMINTNKENMNEFPHKICKQGPIVSRPAETPVKLNPRTALDTMSVSKVCYQKQAEEVNDDNLSHLKVDIVKLPQQSVEENFKVQVRDDLPSDNKSQLAPEDRLSKVNTLAYTVEPDINTNQH